MAEKIADPVYAPRDMARYAKPLFVATILTGSFLLFLVQPMIARMALPRLGGAPNVWNSAMLVYQALLLGGYAYAHRISALRPKTQTGVHVLLLLFAAFWLPVGLMMIQPPQGEAVFLWILWLLMASIGPLFFAISAQAPLMQRWYAFVESDKEPYALYAASNFGSFTGLLAYPLLVEPYMPIAMQQVLWSTLYVCLMLLVAACALVTMRHGDASKQRAPHDAAAASGPRPVLRQCLYWIILAFVPSGLMLSTTTHLTTDLIAMPLLWVIPLGLYLLSFTVAFATKRILADIVTWAAPFIILAGGGGAFMVSGGSSMVAAGVSLVLMFIVAIALHTQMYRTRPSPDHLTLFYLMMSVGGVLGGIFCALVAPLIFDWIYEHPILVVLSALLVPQKALLYPSAFTDMDSGARRRVYYILAAIALAISLLIFKTWGSPYDAPGYFALTAIFCLGLLCMGRAAAFALCVAAVMLGYGGWLNIYRSLDDTRTRSYFGVYTVANYPEENVRRLSHGTTLHGMQFTDAAREKAPTTYYGPQSGVGLALAAAPQLFGDSAKIGIVGLGTGTLGCYRTAGQAWHFFEIDPAMVDIAKDPTKFTYLSKCTPDAPIHIGDARLTLAEREPASFDLLVIDAFSSDAIPMHLLTHEAFDVYETAMTKDGLLVIHISNRYVNLRPVLAVEAHRRGWALAERLNNIDVESNTTGESSSSWVAFARDENRLTELTGTVASADAANANAAMWLPVKQREGFTGWTDDYGSVLPLLKFLEENGDAK